MLGNEKSPNENRICEVHIFLVCGKMSRHYLSHKHCYGTVD